MTEDERAEWKRREQITLIQTQMNVTTHVQIPCKACGKVQRAQGFGLPHETKADLAEFLIEEGWTWSTTHLGWVCEDC